MTTDSIAQNNGISEDTRTAVGALITWLLFPSTNAKLNGAVLRGAYLRILLDSATPDAGELIAAEIAEIKAIVEAGK